MSIVGAEVGTVLSLEVLITVPCEVSGPVGWDVSQDCVVGACPSAEESGLLWAPGTSGLKLKRSSCMSVWASKDTYEQRKIS